MADTPRQETSGYELSQKILEQEFRAPAESATVGIAPQQPPPRAIHSRGPVEPVNGPPALADRLHRSAALFDSFIRECAGGGKVPGDSRARLLAQLVDLREALRPLGDSELKHWPDTGFAVQVRPPRNRARDELITRVQQTLSRREDPGVELSQLIAALTRIRDLIRDSIPAAAAQPARYDSPQPSQPGP